jgi:hypothetical protein
LPARCAQQENKAEEAAGGITACMQQTGGRSDWLTTVPASSSSPGRPLHYRPLRPDTAARPPPQHGWTVEGQRIVFRPQEEGAAAKELPSLQLINHALVYAKELERIV